MLTNQSLISLITTINPVLILFMVTNCDLWTIAMIVIFTWMVFNGHYDINLKEFVLNELPKNDYNYNTG